MGDTLTIEIVTPERAVFKAEAKEVIVPGTAGELGILPDHLPLLTTIHAGALTVIGDERRQFFVDGGFAEILPDRVTILTSRCEGTSDVDIESAKQMVSEAEKAYLELEAKNPDEISAEVRDNYLSSLDKARRRLAFSEEQK